MYSTVTEIALVIYQAYIPVATVSGATAGVLVIRRVWKLIKGSI